MKPQAPKTLRTFGVSAFCLVLATGCSRFRADVAMHDGAVSFHSGDLDGAIAHYERAAQLSPGMQAAWLNLAYSYWSAYNPDDTSAVAVAAAKRTAQGCSDAFQQYLRVHEDNDHADPDNPEWQKADENARGLMVQMWEQSKSWPPAIAYFEGRLRQSPHDDLAMLRLGELNAEAGNWQTALDWYKRRADLDASAPKGVRADAYYTIGTACFQRLHNRPEIAGQQRVDTADEGLDGLIPAQSLRPDHGPTYVYINLLYRERALGEPDGQKRDADLKEAQYYYIYAKYMMTKAPSAAPSAQAINAPSSQGGGSTGAAASLPAPHAAAGEGASGSGTLAAQGAAH